MPVIDSSVYASVVVKDEFYDECRKYMIAEKATLDLAFAEAGNVVWKHMKMGRITEKDAVKRTEALKRLINTSKVYSTESYLVDAVRLAVEYDVSVYDALFISLAVRLNEKLVTTDSKLYNKIRETDLARFVECIR